MGDYVVWTNCLDLRWLCRYGLAVWVGGLMFGQNLIIALAVALAIHFLARVYVGQDITEAAMTLIFGVGILALGAGLLHLT